MADAVIVEDVSKKFRRYHADRPWTLQEAFIRGSESLRAAEDFWALSHISFSIPKGRMVGLVGPNGSGKSTLLRLIGGVGLPEGGRIKVDGRVGALLDLGAGFHPELTGRENLFVAGVIAGLSRREVSHRLDSIVSFAELEPFIDNPVRTYSTGMRMRLAFAVAVHTDPEVLLIDEALSVGDHAFQRKCFDRIAEFQSAGCTILLASHETSVVGELCDEALWLSSGRLVLHGRADIVVKQYIEEADALISRRASVDAETRRRTPKHGPAVTTSQGSELRLNNNRFGSLELELIDVRLLGPDGRVASEVEGDQALRIEIDYRVIRPIEKAIFQVYVFREDGLVCYELDTESDKFDLAKIEDNGSIALQMDHLNLSSGTYYVDVAAYVKNWSYAYDYHHRAYLLRVRGAPAKAALPSRYRWEFNGKQQIDGRAHESKLGSNS